MLGWRVGLAGSMYVVSHAPVATAAVHTKANTCTRTDTDTHTFLSPQMWLGKLSGVLAPMLRARMLCALMCVRAGERDEKGFEKVLRFGSLMYCGAV